MGGKRELYDPASREPFKLSRSRLERFVQCPRCFYLELRHGLREPQPAPYTLNSAVDHLLKKEFDRYREKREPHPLMTERGIDAIPFAHPELPAWRQNFVGVRFLHEPSGFLVYGAVDDLWQTPAGELIVVDYKATGAGGPLTLDQPWKAAYKRQMDIYRWLLRHNGFTVSRTSYFLFAAARRDEPTFGGLLLFNLTLLPYESDDAWVEPALLAARACLTAATPPAPANACAYCAYRSCARPFEGGA